MKAGRTTSVILWILNFLSIVLLFGGVLMFLPMVLMVFLMVFASRVPFISQLIAESMPIGSNYWDLILIIFLTTAYVGLVLVILAGITKLIHNIRQQVYFEAPNLKVIRWVMNALGANIILTVFVEIMMFIRHYTGMSVFFVHPELGFLCLIWATIYVFYVVFEHGLALQQESDQIV